MIKVGTMFAGRYGILEKIGSGGMADVYKAQDTKLNREVAIKVLKPDLAQDEEFVHRFRIEGRAAAGLNNPNIIGIYDVGNVGSTYYIVMELINGITLKDYIRKKGRLTPRECMAISAQVCVGLRAAHAHHIIHRDIKPQNIILSRDGKVKVTDFGIARASTDETKTMADTAMGSVHYIAPEQAKGAVCDERSDIYSLGIVMYEMITGKVPFNKETSIAVALAHMNETMVPPSELNPGCGTALEQIIFRCTQKSRERRYANTTDLLQDLKIAVDDPDHNFEEQEKENLLKSDTMVFSEDDVNTLRKPDQERRARVQGNGTSGQNPDGDIDEEAADRHVAAPAARKVRQGEKSKKADNADNRLFSEDKKEDEKSIFDRILFFSGIVFAVVSVCLLIYIIASLSGCIQTSKKPTKPTETSSAPTTTVDDGIELETYESDKFNPDTQSKVPELLGLSVNNAIRALQEAGLEYKISANIVYSDEYKVGIICEQSYPEGTIVKKGSTIVITMSAGSDKFEIKPEYIGGSLTTFKNAISQFSEINVVYEKVNSETVAANRIISITPESGFVKAGDTVKVVYSAGPENVTVPQLVGYSKSEAIAKLTNNALSVGSISEEFSDEAEAGRVISQQYAPGTVVKNGSSVAFVVSKGPRVEVIPNVMGAPQADAEYALNALGYTVEVVYEVSDGEPGTVVSMSQEPGTQIATNTLITIHVAMQGLPNVVGMNIEEAINTLSQAGFGNVVTEGEETSSGKNQTVKSQTPSAGDTSVNPATEIKLVYYVNEKKVPKMPELKNAGVDEAKSTLEKEGIRYTIKEEAVTNPDLNGIVLRQSVPCGTEVSEGTTVTLVVGKYTAPPSESEPSSETQPPEETTTTAPETEPTTETSAG